MISCQRLSCRLSERACAARYAGAKTMHHGSRGHLVDADVSLTPCRGCPVGAESLRAQPDVVTVRRRYAQRAEVRA